MYYDTLYYKMNDEEKHELLTILINEINIFEDRQANGQWLTGEVRKKLELWAYRGFDRWRRETEIATKIAPRKHINGNVRRVEQAI